MHESATVTLNILSDLHLSQQGLPQPAIRADITILAGDIARPAAAMAWAQAIDTPVLYVAGNHEFYGGAIQDTMAQLKQLCVGTQIQVLDNDELVLNGIRFLGTTLWTDFNLYGPGPIRENAITEALAFIRDFQRIRSDSSPNGCLTPQEMEALFAQQRNWLAQKLDEPFNGPTVVITHHAPSTQSIHPRFEGSLINTCFVSNSEHLMGADRVALWIHGHTHDSFDYDVRGTRVLCNPRGYNKDGINENLAFDPDLAIQVAVAQPQLVKP